MRQHPTTVSRRRFVKTVAAAAAPLFVPRHVLGFAGSPGANDQIIVAVVGVGVRGKQLIRNIKNIKNTARIAAVCDCDTRMIEEVTQEHNADWKTYDDYRRLIDQRKDLTGLLICTPHHQHCLPGMLACQAGLDVYVEKPLSNYVAEGRALVRAARKYGRVVQVGSQQRTMEISSRPTSRTSSRIRPTPNWPRSGKGTAGWLAGTLKTGSTASGRGRNPRLTWRSAIARSRSDI